MNEFLLKPFQKWFKAPVLETPFSTVKMPKTIVSTAICMVSFFLIASGLVFCHVNGMPMVGYQRGQNGQIIATWIDHNGLSSQFLAEGLVAAGIFTLGALSLLAAFKTFGKTEEELSESVLGNICKWLGYTAPLWAFASFMIFNVKIPSYFPAWGAR